MSQYPNNNNNNSNNNYNHHNSRFRQQQGARDQPQYQSSPRNAQPPAPSHQSQSHYNYGQINFPMDSTRAMNMQDSQKSSLHQHHRNQDYKQEYSQDQSMMTYKKVKTNYPENNNQYQKPFESSSSSSNNKNFQQQPSYRQQQPYPYPLPPQQQQPSIQQQQQQQQQQLQQLHQQIQQQQHWNPPKPIVSNSGSNYSRPQSSQSRIEEERPHFQNQLYSSSSQGMEQEKEVKPTGLFKDTKLQVSKDLDKLFSEAKADTEFIQLSDSFFNLRCFQAVQEDHQINIDLIADKNLLKNEVVNQKKQSLFAMENPFEICEVQETCKVLFLIKHEQDDLLERQKRQQEEEEIKFMKVISEQKIRLSKIEKQLKIATQNKIYSDKMFENFAQQSLVR